jgi:hypothetical protein
MMPSEYFSKRKYFVKMLIYLILFDLIVGTPQLNLHYTDWISKSDNNFQPNCLRIGIGDELKKMES